MYFETSLPRGGDFSKTLSAERFRAAAIQGGSYPRRQIYSGVAQETVAEANAESSARASAALTR
jgi:hypothetical protein